MQNCRRRITNLRLYAIDRGWYHRRRNNSGATSCNARSSGCKRRRLRSTRKERTKIGLHNCGRCVGRGIEFVVVTCGRLTCAESYGSQPKNIEIDTRKAKDCCRWVTLAYRGTYLGIEPSHLFQITTVFIEQLV
jgi:hypothetical protein